MLYWYHFRSLLYSGFQWASSCRSDIRRHLPCWLFLSERHRKPRTMSARNFPRRHRAQLCWWVHKMFSRYDCVCVSQTVYYQNWISINLIGNRTLFFCTLTSLFQLFILTGYYCDSYGKTNVTGMCDAGFFCSTGANNSAPTDGSTGMFITCSLTIRLNWKKTK